MKTMLLTLVVILSVMSQPNLAQNFTVKIDSITVERLRIIYNGLGTDQSLRFEWNGFSKMLTPDMLAQRNEYNKQVQEVWINKELWPGTEIKISVLNQGLTVERDTLVVPYMPRALPSFELKDVWNYDQFSERRSISVDFSLGQGDTLQWVYVYFSKNDTRTSLEFVFARKDGEDYRWIFREQQQFNIARLDAIQYQFAGDSGAVVVTMEVPESFALAVAKAVEQHSLDHVRLVAFVSGDRNVPTEVARDSSGQHMIGVGIKPVAPPEPAVSLRFSNAGSETGPRFQVTLNLDNRRNKWLANISVSVGDSVVFEQVDSQNSQFIIGTFEPETQLNLTASYKDSVTWLRSGAVDTAFTLPLLPITPLPAPSMLPTEFSLEQNYPNPFNPGTTIRFDLPEAAVVTLVIYNLLGQEVRTLLRDEQRDAGIQTVPWDGLDAAGQSLPTGVYLYRLEAEDFVQSKKMLMLR